MLQCRGFGPDALRQGGLLMIPLLLLFIAVLSVGIERLLHWIRWKKEQPETMRMFRSELNDFGAGPWGCPSGLASLGRNQLQLSSGKSPSKILRAGRSRNSINKPSLWGRRLSVSASWGQAADSETAQSSLKMGFELSLCAKARSWESKNLSSERSATKV